MKKQAYISDISIKIIHIVHVLGTVTSGSHPTPPLDLLHCYIIIRQCRCPTDEHPVTVTDYQFQTKSLFSA